MKTCPTCVDELIEDKKKLGKGSKQWLVCPSCGFRMRSYDDPDSLIIDIGEKSKVTKTGITFTKTNNERNN